MDALADCSDRRIHGCLDFLQLFTSMREAGPPGSFRALLALRIFGARWSVLDLDLGFLTGPRKPALAWPDP